MQMIAISDNTHTNFTKKNSFNSINEINYKYTLWKNYYFLSYLYDI